MPATKFKIDRSLVAQLVSSQFPLWADLPIVPVEFDGIDNRTFRLGEEMAVRLPSAERYVPQVEKEHHWLPLLAPLLPLPIPVPLTMGVPACGYPWPWSIYRWLEGENASRGRITNLCQFAIKLAEFLANLQQIDPTGGPPPGPHNFFRGGQLAVYDLETRRAIVALEKNIAADTARDVWEVALKTRWRGPSVWLHGDVSASNLLVNKGQLSAVIDFGGLGVGDPACDLTIAWTFFAGDSREAFRTNLQLDDATWARGRGWALWKALITLVKKINNSPIEAEKVRHVIDDVLEEHKHT